jgi:hypothetical protein
MAFARLFPINATDARDGDRTFSERLGLSDDASRALQLIAAEPVHEGPEIPGWYALGGGISFAE